MCSYSKLYADLLSIFIYFAFEAYTKLDVNHCTKDVPNEIFMAT